MVAVDGSDVDGGMTGGIARGIGATVETDGPAEGMGAGRSVLSAEPSAAAIGTDVFGADPGTEGVVVFTAGIADGMIPFAVLGASTPEGVGFFT